MMNHTRSAFAAACLMATAATPALAQQNLGRDGTSWRWDGEIPSGGTVRLLNINGAVHLAASSDGNVHVRAEKHVHSGGDPRSVHYAIVRDGNNIVICAMWNDNATCDANGMRSRDDMDNGDRRRNVSAEMTLLVPSAAHAVANTINGDVSAERIDSDARVSTVNGTIRVTNAGAAVFARTVNGDVNVDTRGGPVSGETVNGSIHASMGSAGNAEMRFRTISGSIDITVPSSFGGEVDLGTVNGSIESRFPLQFDRDHRRGRGSIGNGSARLHATTVNGSITLN